MSQSTRILWALSSLFQTRARQEALQLAICEMPIVSGVEHLKSLLGLRCGYKRRTGMSSWYRRPFRRKKILCNWVDLTKKRCKKIRKKMETAGNANKIVLVFYSQVWGRSVKNTICIFILYILENYSRFLFQPPINLSSLKKTAKKISKKNIKKHTPLVPNIIIRFLTLT